MQDAALGSKTMILQTRQPFDLVSSLYSGQAHRWRRFEDGERSVAGWHAGVVHGTLVKLRQSEYDPNNQSCSLEFDWAPRNGNASIEPILADYFRFNDDLDSIYTDITRDVRVAAMVGKFQGLRLLRQEPWECLIAFICSANSNLPRIHANMEALARTFGTPLNLDGFTCHSFPTAFRLAEAGEFRLRELGLGFRAPYVVRASEMVAQGDIDLDSLRRAPYGQAKEQLMAIPGVGPKVADCVLLHSLDKLEAFPIDVWVRRALLDWYFPRQKPPSIKVMHEWAQDYFGPYAGYAQLFLFHGRRLQK